MKIVAWSEEACLVKFSRIDGGLRQRREIVAEGPLSYVCNALGSIPTSGWASLEIYLPDRRTAPTGYEYQDFNLLLLMSRVEKDEATLRSPVDRSRWASG